MKTSSSSIGLLDILLIIFIVLKIIGVITWSWWLVLIPLWIDLGVIAIFFVIALIFSLL